MLYSNILLFAFSTYYFFALICLDFIPEKFLSPISTEIIAAK